MNKIIQNIFVFIAFCLVGYIVFTNMDGIHGAVREGYAPPPESRNVETRSSTNAELAEKQKQQQTVVAAKAPTQQPAVAAKAPTQQPAVAAKAPTQQASATSAPGVAGNAATYASELKAQSVQMQDAFLISKYSSDYENVIINMSDLVNNLMMQTVLNTNVSQPQSVTNALSALSILNGSQLALNSVMKFIDTN